MNEYSTYALMDAALMVEAENKPWMKRARRPSWIISLYDRPAWSVSPFVVDIDAAYRANRIDVVMMLANLVRPGIHVSFIDTDLSALDLVDHLRQFSYFVNSSGEELTLRIADCVVVPWLHQVMSPEQWAAIHKPIHRWRVHSREGTLAVLPRPSDAEPVKPPLNFAPQQIEALEKAHEPDQLVSNLRAMRVGPQWAETPQVEIELAKKILSVWNDSGQTDAATLLIFARGVFDTKGKLLLVPALDQILEQNDPVRIQRDIEDAVGCQLRHAL